MAESRAVQKKLEAQIDAIRRAYWTARYRGTKEWEAVHARCVPEHAEDSGAGAGAVPVLQYVGGHLTDDHLSVNEALRTGRLYMKPTAGSAEAAIRVAHTASQRDANPHRMVTLRVKDLSALVAAIKGADELHHDLDTVLTKRLQDATQDLMRAFKEIVDSLRRECEEMRVMDAERIAVPTRGATPQTTTAATDAAAIRNDATYPGYVGEAAMTVSGARGRSIKIKREPVPQEVPDTVAFMASIITGKPPANPLH